MLLFSNTKNVCCTLLAVARLFLRLLILFYLSAGLDNFSAAVKPPTTTTAVKPTTTALKQQQLYNYDGHGPFKKDFGFCFFKKQKKQSNKEATGKEKEQTTKHI